MAADKFLFSVIIPVYNVEEYLSDAVDSVVNQTIGFEDNIQIILVNDGSPDDCDTICREYVSKYPDNITYINKENGGVSSARNVGLEQVRGKYVSFLDGDDYWDSKAFAIAYDFFKNHDDIGIVSARKVIFGEGDLTPHHLDYEYDCDKVVDIFRDYDYPQIAANIVFFNAGLFQGRQFDERLQISEDLLFTNEILLDVTKYGIAAEAKYMYRRRGSADSALNTRKNKPSFYKDTMTTVFSRLASISKEKFGEVIPYIQYLCITDLQWSLHLKRPEFLTTSEWKVFQEAVGKIIGDISYEMIAAQRKMSVPDKCYVAAVKNYLENGTQSIPEEKQSLFVEKLRPQFRILQVEGKHIHIEGRAIEKFINPDFTLIAEDEQGEIIEAAYETASAFSVDGIFEDVKLQGNMFSLDLPLRKEARYSFRLMIKGKPDSRKLKPRYDIYSRMPDGNNYGFFCEGAYMVKAMNRQLRIYGNSFKTRLLAERRFDNMLKSINRQDIIQIRDVAKKLKRKGKPIWIISDRNNLAGDNGEALFSYLMGTDARKKYDIYFLLDEDSPDFERVSKIGKVIKFGSTDHIIKTIAASLLISSHMHTYAIGTIKDDLRYCRDLISYKFVFLQHGVTKDDQTRWLGKYQNNTRLFITAGQKEYESILSSAYGYDENIVKLTGFTRYDKLESNSKRVISFMPTWRRSIAGKLINETNVRGYNSAFKDSQYCRFYNQLMNDERLLEAMREHGYTGRFYPHPYHHAQTADFHGNDLITVSQMPDSYAGVFSESDLLVTDYSSVAFDFAYLRKPIIYIQFDKDSFFANHTYKEGYYSYEDDGFGPVCYNYEEAVAAIIQCVQNGCEGNKEYADRADRFFAFNDRENCKRVYKELLKL